MPPEPKPDLEVKPESPPEPVPERPEPEPVSPPEPKPEPKSEVKPTPAPPKPLPTPEPTPAPAPKIEPKPAPPPQVKPLPAPQTPPLGQKPVSPKAPEEKSESAPVVRGPAPLGKKKTPPPKVEKKQEAEKKQEVEKKQKVEKAPKEKKPKKERGPSRWPSRAFGSLSFLFPLAGIAANAMSEEGFDGGIAASWACLGWGVARLLQLWKLYPWKKFTESSLAELEARTEVRGWASVPVILKGEILVPDAARPKQAVLSNGIQTVALERYGLFEIAPKLFGIAGIQRFANQSVTVQGWYRRRGAACVEIKEISTDKKSQRSFVREIRWTCVIALLILIFILMLTSD
jgi:hypothetical protein